MVRSAATPRSTAQPRGDQRRVGALTQLQQAKRLQMVPPRLGVGEMALRVPGQPGDLAGGRRADARAPPHVKPGASPHSRKERRLLEVRVAKMVKRWSPTRVQKPLRL